MAASFDEGSDEFEDGAGRPQPLGMPRCSYKEQGADFGTISIVPYWNARGIPENGSLVSGYSSVCIGSICVAPAFPQGRDAYQTTSPTSGGWFGTIIEQQRERSGLIFSRNRYYDPTTGRFTQEDPIGLAGGLNL